MVKMNWLDEVLADIAERSYVVNCHGEYDEEAIKKDKDYQRAKQTIATKLEEIRSEERIKCQELVNIEALISNREKLSRLERGIYELERLQYIPQMFGDWENVIDDRIATLRKELEAEL